MYSIDDFQNWIMSLNPLQLVEQVPVNSAIIISLLLMAFIFALTIYKIIKIDAKPKIAAFITCLIVVLVIEVYIRNYIITTMAVSHWFAYVFLSIEFLFIIVYGISLYTYKLQHPFRTCGILALILLIYAFVSFSFVNSYAVKGESGTYEQHPNEGNDTDDNIEGFQ